MNICSIIRVKKGVYEVFPGNGKKSHLMPAEKFEAFKKAITKRISVHSVRTISGCDIYRTEYAWYVYKVLD